MKKHKPITELSVRRLTEIKFIHETEKARLIEGVENKKILQFWLAKSKFPDIYETMNIPLWVTPYRIGKKRIVPNGLGDLTLVENNR